jgi:signal transduction histidine kinase
MEETFQTTLAASVKETVPAILDELNSNLRIDSAWRGDQLARVRILTCFSEILERTGQELREVEQSTMYHNLARDIEVTWVGSGVHPSDSLPAGDLLFSTAIRHLATRLRGPHAVEQLAAVATTLHAILSATQRAAVDSHTRALLNRVHQAQLDERLRISRDLHDRVGHGVSAAQRHLELFDIVRLDDPEAALPRLSMVRAGLAEATDAIRQAIADLRLRDPVESLDRALTRFLESFAGRQLAWRVEVNGDQSWAPPAVVDEVFLILRESLRNTIAHAHAGQVLVRVDVSLDGLYASVVDDGDGFVPGESRHGATGLLSMEERAQLLGGSLLVTSAPGRGTHVELRVPIGRATR